MVFSNSLVTHNHHFDIFTCINFIFDKKRTPLVALLLVDALLLSLFITQVIKVTTLLVHIVVAAVISRVKIVQKVRIFIIAIFLHTVTPLLQTVLLADWIGTLTIETVRAVGVVHLHLRRINRLTGLNHLQLLGEHGFQQIDRRLGDEHCVFYSLKKT